MRKSVQRALCCPCGNHKVLALGLCATCYTLRRQDDDKFAGLREGVLQRDGHSCRVCHAPGNRKRSIVVHHRRPGLSVMRWMISLCPRCHARIHRTKVLTKYMPDLLLLLWRELHPVAPEQTHLFQGGAAPREKGSLSAPLFPL